MAAKSGARFPSQIKYIVGNEACERFSFYGMRTILVIFMIQYLHTSEEHAKSTYHLFMTAVYFTPLFGAFIADRMLGKYRTIMYLSILYCCGHAALAIWENLNGLYLGLGLIALGAGGIKPCASAFAGDQFDESNKHLLDKLFELWYFSINIGAFLSSLLIPKILPAYGPSVAFGIPGLLMGLATLIYWAGRKNYVYVPPSGGKDSPQFLAIVGYSLTHRSERKAGGHWMDVAKAKFGNEKVEGAKSAAAVMAVFAAVTFFWALFDQQGSTWVLQAQKMNRDVLGMHLESSQIQALNPIFVLSLIPIFSFVIYPLVEKLGIRVTPLRKMGTGMVLTGLSFVFMALFQHSLDSGIQLSVAWHILPFLVLTMAEVMVSITGLEFAYTQAPRAMKSTLTSFFLLTVSVGNLLTATISYLNPFSGAGEFWFYAGGMFLLSLVFVFMASRYQERSFIESKHA